MEYMEGKVIVHDNLIRCLVCLLLGGLIFVGGCGENSPSQPQAEPEFEPVEVEVLESARNRLFEAIDSRDHGAILAELDDGDCKYFKQLAERYDPSIEPSAEAFVVLTTRALEARLGPGVEPTEADVINLFLDLGWFELMFPRDEAIQSVTPMSTFTGNPETQWQAGVTDGPIDIETLPFRKSGGRWRVQLDAIMGGRRQQLNLEAMGLAMISGFDDQGRSDSSRLSSKALALIRELYADAGRSIPEDLNGVIEQMDAEWATTRDK